VGASRATTYEELRDAISRQYPHLSKQLQRIARYALERPHSLALNTVAAIAEDAEVQPSSMIRFANALGYGGFSEMQRIFRTHLVERSTSYRQRIRELRVRRQAGEGTPEAVLHQFVEDSIHGLERMQEHVRAANLAEAVRLLAAAERVHVLAQRRAFPVACYLAYALNQLEIRTQLLDSVGGMQREFAKGITPREALVAVSFRNYAPDTVEITGECHRRGVPVLAITDSPLSPLTRTARVTLEIGEDSSKPFRSLVEPLCLAQSLVVSLGLHITERAHGARRRAPVARGARA
jgi:DNA-binding MurR/RpiR family transcriptional regulator